MGRAKPKIKYTMIAINQRRGLEPLAKKNHSTERPVMKTKEISTVMVFWAASTLAIPRAFTKKTLETEELNQDSPGQSPVFKGRNYRNWGVKPSNNML